MITITRALEIRLATLHGRANGSRWQTHFTLGQNELIFLLFCDLTFYIFCIPPIAYK
jgi:hypothetical protein